MKRTIMTVICLTVSLVAAGTTYASNNALGYLRIAGKTAEGKPQEKVIAYTPCEADLVFFDDRSLVWTVLFAWAGTGPPLHMGIVVKRGDGSLAVLEAGPDDTVWVTLQDLEKRLHQFQEDYQGMITIRRCKAELAQEQSQALTKFAQAQVGKRYAVGRLLLQGTWFRSRGPVRELVLGKTYLDRNSWICSELAVAAGTVAKLLDPNVVRANVAYPLDLVDNSRYDLSRCWHGPAVWLANRPKESKLKK